MDKVIKKCPLCGAEATLVYEQMKGYIEGVFYDIYECSFCEATSVDPLKSDEKIYEYIYNQANNVPGYERYYRYAQLVEKVRDPLSLLSNSESVYWSVREVLTKDFPQKENVSVLEIGSGLGYLTYSLNKSGYKTTGLDISKDAVAQANKRYGNYYEAGDLFVWSKSKRSKYDCVIMTEIIEHLEDPKSFVKVALSLLKSGGKLIVTTPNKTTAPKPVIWQSDIPPVHLWFFSEESMKYIARDVGRKCDFVDFTEYTKKFYGPSYGASIEQIQVGLPRLSKDGTIFPGRESNNIKTTLFGLRGRYWLSYIRRRFKRKTISSRTTTLSAIFS